VRFTRFKGAELGSHAYATSAITKDSAGQRSRRIEDAEKTSHAQRPAWLTLQSPLLAGAGSACWRRDNLAAQNRSARTSENHLRITAVAQATRTVTGGPSRTLTIASQDAVSTDRFFPRPPGPIYHASHAEKDEGRFPSRRADGIGWEEEENSKRESESSAWRCGCAPARGDSGRLV